MFTRESVYFLSNYGVDFGVNSPENEFYLLLFNSQLP